MISVLRLTPSSPAIEKLCTGRRKLLERVKPSSTEWHCLRGKGARESSHKRILARFANPNLRIASFYHPFLGIACRSIDRHCLDWIQSTSSRMSTCISYVPITLSLHPLLFKGEKVLGNNGIDLSCGNLTPLTSSLWNLIS